MDYYCRCKNSLCSDLLSYHRGHTVALVQWMSWLSTPPPANRTYPLSLETHVLPETVHLPQPAGV